VTLYARKKHSTSETTVTSTSLRCERFSKESFWLLGWKWPQVTLYARKKFSFKKLSDITSKGVFDPRGRWPLVRVFQKKVFGLLGWKWPQVTLHARNKYSTRVTTVTSKLFHKRKWPQVTLHARNKYSTRVITVTSKLFHKSWVTSLRCQKNFWLFGWKWPQVTLHARNKLSTSETTVTPKLFHKSWVTSLRCQKIFDFLVGSDLKWLFTRVRGFHPRAAFGRLTNYRRVKPLWLQSCFTKVEWHHFVVGDFQKKVFDFLVGSDLKWLFTRVTNIRREWSPWLRSWLFHKSWVTSLRCKRFSKESFWRSWLGGVVWGAGSRRPSVAFAAWAFGPNTRDLRKKHPSPFCDSKLEISPENFYFELWKVLKTKVDEVTSLRCKRFSKESFWRSWLGGVVWGATFGRLGFWAEHTWFT